MAIEVDPVCQLSTPILFRQLPLQCYRCLIIKGHPLSLALMKFEPISICEIFNIQFSNEHQIKHKTKQKWDEKQFGQQKLGLQAVIKIYLSYTFTNTQCDLTEQKQSPVFI